MKETFRDKFTRIFVGCVLAVIIIGGSILTYPHYRTNQALRRQDAELQAMIDTRKREIQTLIDYQRRFRSDPEFVESIARQNHRVHAGELVFVFENE